MKFDMQNLLSQAQNMQKEMEKIKSEVSQKEVTGESGGGMVSVRMNGANRVISIRIAKEIINPDESEMLEDLVVAAINKANETAAAMVQAEMSKVTGMLPNIPGLDLGF